MSTKFSRKWTKIFPRHDYLFVSICLWLIYIVKSCSSSPHFLHVPISFWAKDLPGYAEPRSSLSPPLMAYKWPQLSFLLSYKRALNMISNLSPSDMLKETRLPCLTLSMAQICGQWYSFFNCFCFCFFAVMPARSPMNAAGRLKG